MSQNIGFMKNDNIGFTKGSLFSKKLFHFTLKYFIFQFCKELFIQAADKMIELGPSMFELNAT